LRRAAQVIDDDESLSVQRLIALAPATEDLRLDLRAHQLNRASGRINLALLAQLRPLDLQTGEDVDVPALLDDGELLRIPSATGRIDSIGSIFLNPVIRDDEIAETFSAASVDVLVSQGLDPSSLGVAEPDLSQIVSTRLRVLATLLPERLESLSEPGINDRPAIEALVVPDNDQ
jgi:hypothetical protein